jgi:hypothetical protein
MNYNFSRLNPHDFEHLVQSLTQRMLGYDSLVFGAGPDGARELTYSGKAKMNFPNEIQRWEGYWVVQAKYKTKDDSLNDFSWVEKQFKAEMKKFGKKNYKKPDNYIFITNANLTATPSTGGRDKIEELKKSYKTLIPNIFIGGYEELCKFLDNNRDVATAYASFIFSGDVLMEVLKYFKKENIKATNSIEIIKKYLEKEFKTERTSKLIHAGDLTHQVNLENVFTDLIIKQSQHSDQKIYALNHIVNIGNNIARLRDKQEKIVLIGGAGAGKSTITQFTIQLYIAFFLKSLYNSIEPNINSFIEEYKKSNINIPSCYRIPFKIVLKDFAGWLNENKGKEHTSILNYLKFKIHIETGETLETSILKDFFSSLSFIFIFDGLDEVPISSNRDLVLSEINDFVEIELYDINCDAIIIATTRPQGYSSEFNVDKYKHYNLSDMTNEICLSYINKLISNLELSAERGKEYKKTLENSLVNEITSNLMRTPLQATIMTVLVVSGGEPSSNKYSLFKEYYNIIFKREKQKKVSNLINNYELQIHKIHNQLGFKLQLDSENSNNTYSYIGKQDFEKIIIKHLKEDEWEIKEINNFVGEFRKIITQRLVFISEVQEDKIGFIVRSLQEFFAANFYMDSDDIRVRQRIKNISTNSYWRNTLLFSVGYIRANKEHLIDDVYTLCEDLNGIDLSPTETDYRDIVKLGSWLSLDILSEGILNDSPRLVNRFSRLLENLMILNRDYNHNKFDRLQNRVKEVWILDKFLSNLNVASLEDIQKETVFYIAINLTSSNDTNIKNKARKFLEDNLVDDSKNIIASYLHIVEKKDNDFYKLCAKLLLNSQLLSMEYLIIDDIGEKQVFLNYILNTQKNDYNLNKLLVENILLIFISSLYTDDMELKLYDKILSLLAKKKIKMEGPYNPWSYISVCIIQNKTIISNTVELYYNSLSKINLSLFEVIRDLAVKYNITYLIDYCDYNIKPSKLNLNKFLNSFYSLPSLLQNKFIEGDNDWLLNYIFGEFKKGIILNIDDILLEIGDDFNDWLAYEDVIFSGNNILLIRE